MPKVACSCGRLLSTWDSLMAHKRKHAKMDNGFNCDLCSQMFCTKTGLSIHIKFKHERPAKSYKCHCGREFKDNGTYKAHVRTHLPDEEKFSYECHICGKKVVSKYSLRYHISTIHEGEKHHFCQLCGKGFGNKSNLRSHLISHSTENVSCNVCGKIFKNRISLQSHRKVHKPSYMRKFPCENCDKTFHNRNHLTRHMAAHSDERTYKCHYPSCANEYKWQKDLNNHIVAVHGRKLILTKLTDTIYDISFQVNVWMNAQSAMWPLKMQPLPENTSKRSIQDCGKPKKQNRSRNNLMFHTKIMSDEN